MAYGRYSRKNLRGRRPFRKGKRPLKRKGIYKKRPASRKASGMVDAGPFGKGQKRSTLLISQIPKAPNNKPLKIYERNASTTTTLTSAGAVDPAITSLVGSTSGTGGINKGNNYNMRIANIVRPVCVQLKMLLGAPASSGASFDPMGRMVWRVMVVVDTQPNKLLMTYTDLVQDTSHRWPNAFLNYATMGRFKVLFDKKYKTPRQAKDKDGNPLDTTIEVDETISLKGFPVHYALGQQYGPNTQIERNNIYVVHGPAGLAGTDGDALDQQYYSWWSSRLFFTD
jgi:hypothetical protein